MYTFSTVVSKRHTGCIQRCLFCAKESDHGKVETGSRQNSHRHRVQQSYTGKFDEIPFQNVSVDLSAFSNTLLPESVTVDFN